MFLDLKTDEVVSIIENDAEYMAKVKEAKEILITKPPEA